MLEPGELKTLIYDNVSGAREIAQRGLTLVQRAAATSVAPTPAALLDELADVSVKIIRSKPEMAQVFQALNRLLLAAEQAEAEATEVGPFRLGVLAELGEQLKSLDSNLERVAGHAQPLIANGAVLLTHSRSSTVLAALRRARREGKLVDLVVPESRPNLEGRTLARELSEEQFPVRFVVDALLATAVEGADRVLLGADAVTPHGLVNKIGTRLVALAARDAKVPVTVLAESSKAWVKKLDPTLGLLTGRPRDPREVWDGAPLGVEVVNLYFERTPLELVSDIVDEEGVHRPSEYWDRIRSRGYARRLEAAFPDELF